ncbi:thymidylate synthase [Lysinibacillus fusiformis]|uniref:thymidylate synthase n=1 Tax=Lysinibacillus fusiformis TaxID=28031 RepID=UPI002D792F23|nr:thymidylate synthase [Lysinibacillus fusiformis]WRS98589.1 thymidylate synthase [Lysinibacillus fusiformis]
MHIFKGNNFSEIYFNALKFAIKSDIQVTSSRNGAVKDLGPAFFEIDGDCFRMPLLHKRRFNPYFALTEFSWFITGSNDLLPLQHYIKNYKKYSDDGSTLFGAYGYRLRNKFSTDQIQATIDMLKDKPDTRRAVLTIWSIEDLGKDSKDIPCNTSIMFKIRAGKLDMTVINRSNDLFLGIPYNVLMFYLLQCYIAKEIGIEVGFQRHFSDSLHLYEQNIKAVENILNHNSLEEIRKVYSELVPSSIEQYLNLPHHDIIELKFENIRNNDYENFFNSYIMLGEGEDKERIIEILPKDLLGYSAYLWLTGTENDNTKLSFIT